MDIINKLLLMQRIDELIRRKATGSPDSLSRKLNISRRNVFNIIKTMKHLEAPIVFCRMRNSYCYEREGALSFGFIPN